MTAFATPEQEQIVSDRSTVFDVDGQRLKVLIHKHASESGWILETVDEHGTSTVWGERFPTEDEAWKAFLATIRKEGTKPLVEPIERLSFG